MAGKIRALFIILLALAAGGYVAYKYNLQKLVSPINETRTSVSESVLPLTKKSEVITDLQVLDIVNTKRELKGLNKVEINSELTKAAKIRLSVINEYDDWEGSASGMTREKAVQTTTYPYFTIGDIYVNSIENLDQLNTEIDKDSIDSGTLYLKDFVDIGIAVKKNDDGSGVYIIFGNRSKKTSVVSKPTPTKTQQVTWGGPELWNVVNKRRLEFGVGQLTRKDELCTIASIRLNQLLELKKLDGHAGFQPVLDRSDLKWIGDKYNLSEYLAQGYPTPEETVKGWENTLGHRSLLTGGEYVWGCVYSQGTFAVAITAY